MAERVPPRRLDATLRVAAALVATLPVAVLASVVLARFLPFAEAARFTLGFTLAIPLWVGGMCVVFLTRDARRVWLGAFVATLILALVGFGGSP
jgi:hypothetical protein